MIVAAFAAGDRVALRPLLADETYRSFEQAIAAREAAGETQRSEIRAIAAGRASRRRAWPARSATITVRFVSDQIAETLGARRAAGGRRRCGDRDHRSLDVRARPRAARPGLAADRRPAPADIRMALVGPHALHCGDCLRVLPHARRRPRSTWSSPRRPIISGSPTASYGDRRERGGVSGLDGRGSPPRSGACCGRTGRSSSTSPGRPPRLGCRSS